MELVFWLFLFLIVASIVYFSLKNGISPMPSSSKAKEAVKALLPKVQQGTIYELGSGFGCLVDVLAKRYPHCLIMGYETSLIPYFFSKIRFLGRKNVKIVRKDFFSVSLKDAKLVVCYLYPQAMQRLTEKFAKELADHTTIISNTFAIPLWRPFAVKEVLDIYRTKIYMYTKRLL